MTVQPSQITERERQPDAGLQTSGEPVVRIVDIHKDYYLGSVVVPALRGVSLEVYPGEFIAIMGASGSGKSTLLNLLGCLDRPTRGQYYLGGRNVANLSDDELSEIRSRYIGFIFQSYNLIPQLTAFENIEVPLYYQGNVSPESKQRVVELARLVGLERWLNHKPTQLSGGQQQRVAIARALINDPYIILADEPTGNLDTSTSYEIMKLLVQLNDMGKTIIMVTHEPDIAAYAKRAVHMRDGKIIKDEPITQRRVTSDGPVPAGAQLTASAGQDAGE